MKKEVVIHAAELKETDEAGLDGYIDPKLLLSQNSFQKKQSSAMNLSAPFSRENQTESSDNDVSSILSQVKSITTLNQATTSASVAPEKRSIADLFSKSATEISSSTTKSTNKVLNPSQLLLVKSENTLSAKLREKATAPIPGSASSIVRSESKRTIGLHSTDCYSASLDDSSKPSSQPLSQSGIRSFFSQEYSQSTSSSTNDSQVAASQVDQKSKKSLFKQLIGM